MEPKSQLESLHLEEIPSPVVINPSTTPDHVSSGVRDVLIFIGGITAVFGFLAEKDLAGLMSWIQSTEALPFLGLVVAGLSLIWRHITLRRKKAQLVAVGLAAPNSTAVVLGVDVEKKK